MNKWGGMEISQVTVVTREGVGITRVGDDGVAKIEDCSIEWPDAIDYVYHALNKDGKILKEIRNCPVEINYLPVTEPEPKFGKGLNALIPE